MSEISRTLLRLRGKDRRRNIFSNFLYHAKWILAYALLWERK